VAGALGLIALWVAAGWAAELVKPKHKYLGVQACAKMCHKSKSKGAQLPKWEEGPHSKAWKNLGEAKAKEVAKKLGIDDPQKDPKCLRCHAPEHNVDPAFLPDGFSIEDGVQCESCHGPGADYKGMAMMKKRDKAIANGLIVGDEKTCRGCHNEQSPTWDPERRTTKDGKKVGFDYETMWGEIAHYRPKKD
jgi:hypothetical protein